MDNKLFNEYIKGRIESAETSITKLKKEIEDLKKTETTLKSSLNCNHEIVTDFYSDYYSKITTFYCKKCGFSLEF